MQHALGCANESGHSRQDLNEWELSKNMCYKHKYIYMRMKGV